MYELGMNENDMINKLIELNGVRNFEEIYLFVAPPKHKNNSLLEQSTYTRCEA